jgi:hypothetical protein
MSKNNKVNKSNYDQGGRLTPDEIGRERKRQQEVSGHGSEKRERVRGAAPVAPKAARPERAARAASRSRSAREE